MRAATATSAVSWVLFLPLVNRVRHAAVYQLPTQNNLFFFRTLDWSFPLFRSFSCAIARVFMCFANIKDFHLLLLPRLLYSCMYVVSSRDFPSLLLLLCQKAASERGFICSQRGTCFTSCSSCRVLFHACFDPHAPRSGRHLLSHLMLSPMSLDPEMMSFSESMLEAQSSFSHFRFYAYAPCLFFLLYFSGQTSPPSCIFLPAHSGRLRNSVRVHPPRCRFMMESSSGTRLLSPPRISSLY